GLLRQFQHDGVQAQPAPAELDAVHLPIGFALLREGAPALRYRKHRAEVFRRVPGSKTDAPVRPVVREALQTRQDAPACQRAGVVVATFDLVERIVAGRMVPIVYGTDNGKGFG